MLGVFSLGMVSLGMVSLAVLRGRMVGAPILPGTLATRGTECRDRNREQEHGDSSDAAHLELSLF